MTRNLVIVRAGDSSLHPRWLAGGARSWDLLVNYFGDDPVLYRRDDVLRIDSKGPKWPALHALITAERDFVARYDYVWLPDDDIDCTTRDINRLFELCHRYQLWLAQPALDSRSYFSWSATLQGPGLRLRWTNFVEVMVPCFARGFLLQCLPTMAATLSGWGLDFIWPRLADTEPRRVAIIDAVRVRHTRPIGAANYALLRERGISARDEMLDLLASHGISDLLIRIDALETWGGLRLSERSRLAKLLLAAGYAFMVLRGYALRRPNRWLIDKQLRRAIKAPTVLDNWPLEPDELATRASLNA